MNPFTENNRSVQTKPSFKLNMYLNSSYFIGLYLALYLHQYATTIMDWLQEWQDKSNIQVIIYYPAILT